MSTLAIDIETKSGYDLLKTGVYKYVESPEFAIILFAYKINDGPVSIIDLTKNSLSSMLIGLLTDKTCVKKAYNASFERACVNKFFHINSPAEQWDCTLVRSSLLTYPLSLDQCSTVMGTAPKDKKGKALIKLFCVKMTPPEEKPLEWQQFKNYCVDDVKAEQGILSNIHKHKVPGFERNVWLLDQEINSTGVMIDTDLVDKAIRCEADYTSKLLVKAKQITGLDNPGSVAQLKKWIESRTGEVVKSLSKGIELVFDDPVVNQVLEMRGELSKTSVQKYQAMREGVCSDQRLRGLLQYYGANRTGRWAGRMVQVQNLPRNNMHDLDLARQILKTGDVEVLEMVYGDVNYVLSQLIRTAFIPKPGHKFIISDFSSIEARVLAWLCNEKWRLQVFNDHGKIYEASAAMMFSIPVESVTKGSDLRTKGKIAELALGYGGAVGALERMGGSSMGLDEKQMLQIVKLWRKASPSVVKFWYNVESMVQDTIETRRVNKINGLTIYIDDGYLFIELPSGRRLTYIEPKITEHGICYMGLDQMTKQWKKVYTYGGKLTENIVQAIARDCLADAMLRLQASGYSIVMHVHDEVILEVPDNTNVKCVDKIMSQEISWAKGLPLKAEGFESYYYKKE